MEDFDFAKHLKTALSSLRWGTSAAGYVRFYYPELTRRQVEFVVKCAKIVESIPVKLCKNPSNATVSGEIRRAK